MRAVAAVLPNCAEKSKQGRHRCIKQHDAALLLPTKLYYCSSTTASATD
jgi:hypothetical protein